jgi:hypothetical protein
MQVSFCTPLVRENNCFLNAVEKYNWFGSRVVVIGSGSSMGTELEDPSAWYVTALKVLSMILTAGLLPLLALIIKAISRCQLDPIQLPPSPEELCQQAMAQDAPMFVEAHRLAELSGFNTLDPELWIQHEDRMEELRCQNPAAYALYEVAKARRRHALSLTNPRFDGILARAEHQATRIRDERENPAVSAAQQSPSPPSSEERCRQVLEANEPLYQQMIARAQALEAGNPNPPVINPTIAHEALRRVRRLDEQFPEADRHWDRLFAARLGPNANNSHFQDVGEEVCSLLLDPEESCRWAMEKDEPMYQQILARARALKADSLNAPQVNPALWAAHIEVCTRFKDHNPVAYQLFIAATLRRQGELNRQCHRHAEAVIETLRTDYENAQRHNEN